MHIPLYTEHHCTFSPPLKNSSSSYLNKAAVQYGQDSIVYFLSDKERWRKQGRLICSPKPQFVQCQHSNYRHGRWIFMSPHSSQWRSHLTAQPALQQQPALASPPWSSIEFIWQLKVFKTSKSSVRSWVYTVFFMLFPQGKGNLLPFCSVE